MDNGDKRGAGDGKTKKRRPGRRHLNFFVSEETGRGLDEYLNNLDGERPTLTNFAETALRELLRKRGVALG